MAKIKSLLALGLKFVRNYRAYVFAAFVALIGIALIVTHASSSFVASEAETATLTTPATVGTDAAASGGQYIQFSSVTPPPPPPPSGFQPTAPYYATFFYPWYKNPTADGSYSYWQDNGNNPPNTWFSHYLPDIDPSRFDPASELYSSNDYNTFKWQLNKLAEAKQEVAIGSWFGQGTKQDDFMKKTLGVTNPDPFMARADNPYPNLRWAMYYENEGFANPSVSTLVSDLNHIADNFANSPYFLKIGGLPVIFCIWRSR